MSLLNPIDGEAFKLSVVKFHQNNPAKKFTNTYEAIVTGETTTFADLNAMAAAIVQFEVAMHYDVIRFDRYVLSTFNPDSNPYQGDEFVTEDLSVSGGISSAIAEMQPLDVTLMVRRETLTGRQGRLLFRGALTEGDVAAPAGEPTLANPTSIQTRLDDAMDDVELGEYLADPATGASASGVALALVSRTSTSFSYRWVTGFSVGGVTLNKQNHRYFNRS